MSNETQGSVATVVEENPDLDAIMKEGLEQFEIHEEDLGLDAAAPGSAQEMPTPANQTGSETNTGEERPQEVVVKPPEETQAGDNELQRQVTALTEENQRLAKQLSAKAAAEASEAVKAAEATNDQAFLTFASKRRAQSLDEIDALDPDKPEYRQEVAAAYARADLDIAKKTRTAAAPADPAPPATEVPDTHQPPSASPSPEKMRLFQTVEDFISAPEIGLEKNDLLFWTYANQAPDKDDKGQPIPFRDQVQWAVDQRNQYISRVTQGNKTRIADEANRRAEAHQLQEMPLARAASTAPAASSGVADDKPVSLADAVDSAKELRRL